MTSTTFTIAELAISPLNVRQCEEDAEATDALEASLLEHGLMFPLIVHVLDKKIGKAKFGVLAGGRRFRAFGKLIANGDLPKDHPIRCEIRKGAEVQEIVELSLTENLLRRELRPWEVHAAIAKLAGEGLSTDEIARHTGQREPVIAQWLRLGELDAPIFAAFAAGKLSADQAKAYAATEDRQLQRAAFEHFARQPAYAHTAHAIRAFLKVGDAEAKRLLLFVGEGLYRARGGKFELDLFADGLETDRGRVTDEVLLRELAEEKLTGIRDKVRVDTQHRDLPFRAEPPSQGGHVDHSLEIDPPKRKGRIKLPDGDVVATIAIDREGEARPRFWWASRKAKADAQKAGATPKDALQPSGGNALSSAGTYEGKARAAIKEGHGFTADGFQVVRSLRRDLLRALLLHDARCGGSLGRDYLTWAQLRARLSIDSWAQTGARGLASDPDTAPVDVVRPHLSGVEASNFFADVMEDVAKHEAFAAETACEGLAAFLDAEPEFKKMAESLLAGLAMIRSANAEGFRVEAHDLLAERAGGDAAFLRQMWIPTTDFVGLLPKLKRLELAEPFVGTALTVKWAKLKDRDITAAVTAVLNGVAEHGDEEARSWVHPLLDFGATNSPEKNALTVGGDAGDDNGDKDRGSPVGAPTPVTGDENSRPLEVPPLSGAAMEPA